MGKEVHCYSVPDYASAALAADVEDIFAQSAAARALGLEKCAALREVILVPTSGLSTVYAYDGGIVLAY